MSEAVLLLLVGVLVLVNGFFVAAEFALVRSRVTKLEGLVTEGVRGAERALDQVRRVDEYVAACQVGITLASIGIGFLGEPAVARLLEPMLGDFFSHGVAIALAIIIAYTIITLAHVIAGEQTPKMVAIARAELVSRRIAMPLELFRLAVQPLILITNTPARWFVRHVLRIDTSEVDHAGADELRVLITRGAAGGVIDPGEAGMLSGVFHLHEQEAREVMTPIPAVVTVDVSESAEEALRRCISSGHTRLLVVEDENPDRVRGVVHNNSLARLYMVSGARATVEPAIRDVPIFPETKPLDDLLAALQQVRSSMAVVSDEYGRTVGIVTVEDILEEVVGEIEDETDPRAASIRRLADGDWYVRGHVPLGDLEDVGISLPVDSDAFNSIGGYVFSELGRLPRRGDRVAADGYELRVESVRDNRIVAVRVHSVTAEHSLPEGERSDGDANGAASEDGGAGSD